MYVYILMIVNTVSLYEVYVTILCVCMYMYIYVYIKSYIYVYIYSIYTIKIYIYTCICVCASVRNQTDYNEYLLFLFDFYIVRDIQILLEPQTIVQDIIDLNWSA